MEGDAASALFAGTLVTGAQDPFYGLKYLPKLHALAA
jgi:hypothetical protein